MGMRFFNTLGRRLEEFKEIEAGAAKMYTCGPTVYNFAHIGNFRAYVFEDLLRRALEYHGFKVTQVMNLTDVDDKTIRDSKAQGLKLSDFTAKYKKAFFDDLKTLRIEPAEQYPEATAHVPEMIKMIEVLFEKGFAYKASDGSVYFSIAKLPDYGKLAKIDMSNQRSGVRVRNDEYAKDSVADFALWKAWDANDGDVKWASPWGEGRPGWHLECSAMSQKYLGKTFDIHTGGIDNMFPHHEDEIAQSEAANGCRFVNFWMHCEHLIVDGQKMSKSLGNFYTLRDLLAKGYSGPELRWVLLGTHYRSKLNFNVESLGQARSALKKFKDFFGRLKALPQGEAGLAEAVKLSAEAKAKFKDAVGDDLNIAEALSAVYTLERAVNGAVSAGRFGAKAGAAVLEQFRDFDKVLAVFDVDAAEAPVQDAVPAEILELALKRVEAKKAKDFKAADALRDQIKAAGYLVTDTPKGPELKKL
jgi:cysteinyl-tRNA synthetase